MREIGQACVLIVIALQMGVARAEIPGNNGVNSNVMGLLNQVARHFGKPIKIISGCRSRKHNTRIRGAKESYHLRCMAADFEVTGVSTSTVYKFAAALPGRGGVGTYCGSPFMHIDVGPYREWHWGCGNKQKTATIKRSGGRQHYRFYVAQPASFKLGSVHFTQRKQPAPHVRRRGNRR